MLLGNSNPGQEPGSNLIAQTNMRWLAAWSAIEQMANRSCEVNAISAGLGRSVLQLAAVQTGMTIILKTHTWIRTILVIIAVSISML